MARPRVFSPTAPKAVWQKQTQKEKQIKRKDASEMLASFCLIFC
jgi:hypothetical protein